MIDGSNESDGLEDGDVVGDNVGVIVGAELGSWEGSVDGSWLTDGASLGMIDGFDETDGLEDGDVVGDNVGSTDGSWLKVGEILGASDGSTGVGEGVLSRTPTIKVWSTQDSPLSIAEWLNLKIIVSAPSTGISSPVILCQLPSLFTANSVFSDSSIIIKEK